MPTISNPLVEKKRTDSAPINPAEPVTTATLMLTHPRRVMPISPEKQREFPEAVSKSLAARRLREADEDLAQLLYLNTSKKLRNQSRMLTLIRR
jgi:hypothetical protein